MLIINSVEIKNFLSCGQNIQCLTLNDNPITLILGENLDNGGQNGVGKCCCINTMVRVRNTNTGEISELTIGELYNHARNKKSNGEV